MRALVARFALLSAVVLASWGMSGTERVARADQVLRSVRSDAAMAANWRVRRWYGHPYIGPYWDGGYYSPYANPPLYYRRIAPGVYYYF